MSKMEGVALLIPGENTVFKVGKKFLGTEAVITRVSTMGEMIMVFGAKEGEKEKLLAEIYNAPWIAFYD